MSGQAGPGNPLRAQTQLSFSNPQSSQTPSSPIKSSHRLVSNVARPFTAPAHKHAHHLHSIPPREKSTRTLIIDHMLWAHGRTRFAQARAELGMTDRTGGPSSPNYIHRFRPENFEEDEEQSSDGEDVSRLKVRHDLGPENHGTTQEEGIRRRDLSLAQSLNLRAESLEKVVTAMLDQPPTIEPKHGDESHPSSTPRPHRHLHTLPNGVRLRLALGTVINDLFARTDQSSQPKAMPPYPQEFSLRSSTANASDRILPSSYLAPPPVVIALATISAVGQAFPTSSDRNTFVHSSSVIDVSHSNRLVCRLAFFTSYDINILCCFVSFREVKVRLASNVTSHTRAIYANGASHGHLSSSIHSRCFRHLRTACDICAEPHSKVHISGSRKGRANSLSAAIGHDASLRGNPIGAESGGITGWRDGSGIGSGLAKSGSGGTMLRRAASVHEAGFATTYSLELIPRFLRLSALVAIELGNEALPEGGPDDDLRTGNDSAVADEISIREYDSSRLDKPSSRIYDDSLRPSTEWYILFAGLLTRAVLDGYLTAGWKGIDAVECLLSIGLRVSYSNGKNEEQGDGAQNETQDSTHRNGDLVDRFEEFDPDELPSLHDAANILFPSLRTNFPHMKDGTEAEYEGELLERIRMVSKPRIHLTKRPDRQCKIVPGCTSLDGRPTDAYGKSCPAIPR